MAGQSSHLDVDRVVADSLVPRFGLHHELARAILGLPGFVDFDAEGWGHRVKAGLLANHPAANQAARYQPGVSYAAGTGLSARRLRGFGVADNRPQDYDRHKHGQRRKT